MMLSSRGWLFSSTLQFQVFRYVEHKFGGQKLPEGELVKLSERPNRHQDMTLFEFKDMVLHVLDSAANLSLFLDIYNPACEVFHQQLFEMK
jgi:predicted glycosyltransferase